VRSVLRTAAGVVVMVALVGGCGLSSSQLGAAAFVGATKISLGQVHGQFVAALAKESPQVRAELAAGHQFGDLSRKILTVRIQHQLLEVAARRAGLKVDQARVNRMIKEVGGAQAGSKGTIFDANSYRQRAKDKLLMAALGRLTLRNSAVTVDYTTADTRTAAKRRVEELSQAGATRARQSIEADLDAGKDAELDKRIVAADDPIFATTPAFGVTPGTVVAFQVQDTTPWVIMVVSSRTNRGAQPSAHAPNIDQIDPAVLEAIGLRQLGPVAQELGVRLSPRYGVWDPVNLQVVSDENETSGFLAPLRVARLG
jgi:hypothetical protein